MLEKILPHYNPNIKVNGPYLNKTQNRNFVRYLYPNGTKRVITYAKYLMEQNLKRELLNSETVDHKDRNKLNDVIENLQILDLVTHSKLDSKRAKLIEIVCVWCSSKIFRKPNVLRRSSKLKKSGPFCSKKCSGEYGAEIQNNRQEKLPIQKPIQSTYYYNDK